eukprot:CAMPEP_0179172530 /NCGR_PEP_ID=MMETSP0796-20121207/85096_1 /TAXON_ID=73915 /ORGANISM="Pyrodinium bahamense, Strain pbaha01" /LENGTH=81 /DNA_ID=CAMNT_0020875681 /DNA_START=20 /DNA_END=262 /DNA_ORIENTATION=-
MKSFFCGSCCTRDWCGCDSVCDCLAALKAKGYTVPPSGRAAYAVDGQNTWPAVLGWRIANIPGWTTVAEEELEVKDSTLEG